MIRIDGEPYTIDSMGALIEAVDQLCDDADLQQNKIEDALKENVERAQRGEAGEGR